MSLFCGRQRPPAPMPLISFWSPPGTQNAYENRWKSRLAQKCSPGEPFSGKVCLRSRNVPQSLRKGPPNGALGMTFRIRFQYFCRYQNVQIPPILLEGPAAEAGVTNVEDLIGPPFALYSELRKVKAGTTLVSIGPRSQCEAEAPAGCARHPCRPCPPSACSSGLGPPPRAR